MAGNDPVVQFVGFYYPDILRMLRSNKARFLPEHTETDPHDPINALQALFAVMGHQQGARLDHSIRESFPTTAQQRASFVALAKMLGTSLAAAVPAEVDLVADLSSDLASTFTVLNAYSIAGTEGDVETPPILFGWDSATDLQVGPTAAWDVIGDDGGTQTVLSLPAAPWASVDAQDAVYFIHPGIMYNKIEVEITTTPTPPTTLRWEYYDDLHAGPPNTVAVAGGGLVFNVNDVVGLTRADGLIVTVKCLLTGAEAEATLDYSGGVNRAPVTGYLGQTSVSTDPTDYLVTCTWPELPGLVDGTTKLSVDGTVSWTLPQTEDRRWAETTIAGVTGYAIRARVVVDGPATIPTLNVSQATKTTWSVLWQARQGERVTDRLGTTDAESSGGQSFTLQRTPFLELDTITVDGQEWAQVTNLLASAAFDRHFTLEEQPDASMLLTFGDGSNGAVPGATVPVVAIYWIGGADEGNVGEGQITKDRTGNARLRNLRNPRPAAGWVVAEGATETDRDRLRVALPASLRARDRAVAPQDYETLALAFRTADGSQVAARAKAIEEGLGLRTVDLVIVGPGGVAPSTADLTELDEYFNGEVVGLQRVGGIGIPGVLCTSRAHSSVAVDVTATVDVLAQYATDAEETIEAALGAELQPTAHRLELDASGRWVRGSGYWWEFDGTVTQSAIMTVIHTAMPGVIGATLSGWSNVALDADQLPRPGTITITINAVTL